MVKITVAILCCFTLSTKIFGQYLAWQSHVKGYEHENVTAMCPAPSLNTWVAYSIAGKAKAQITNGYNGVQLNLPTMPNTHPYHSVIVNYSQYGTINCIIRITSTAQAIVNCMQTDSAGNLIIAGYFQGLIHFQNQAGNGHTLNAIAVSDSKTQAFTAKYTALGKLLWVKQYSATFKSAYPTHMVLDSTGASYTLVYTPSAHAFVTDSQLISSHHLQFYIVKHNSIGNQEWILAASRNANPYGLHILEKGTIALLYKDYDKSQFTLFAHTKPTVVYTADSTNSLAYYQCLNILPNGQVKPTLQKLVSKLNKFMSTWVHEIKYVNNQYFISYSSNTSLQSTQFTTNHLHKVDYKYLLCLDKELNTQWEVSFYCPHYATGKSANFLVTKNGIIYQLPLLYKCHVQDHTGQLIQFKNMGQTTTFFINNLGQIKNYFSNGSLYQSTDFQYQSWLAPMGASGFVISGLVNRPSKVFDVFHPATLSQAATNTDTTQNYQYYNRADAFVAGFTDFEPIFNASSNANNAPSIDSIIALTNQFAELDTMPANAYTQQELPADSNLYFNPSAHFIPLDIYAYPPYEKTTSVQFTLVPDIERFKLKGIGFTYQNEFEIKKLKPLEPEIPYGSYEAQFYDANTTYYRTLHIYNKLKN